MSELNSEILIQAYCNGYFPMADPEKENEIHWYEPHSRGIIPLDSYKIPKNLIRKFRNGNFEYKINGDFEQTIRACSQRKETWISEEIINAYIDLHKKGYALSFEAWQNNELVGGLYGVSIGKAFFGESMFHTVTDASKLALVYLLEFLTEENYQLLDTQYITDHLKQFGVIEIPQMDYVEKLHAVLDLAT